MFRVSARFLLPLACVLTLAACQPKVDTAAEKVALATVADTWETAYNGRNAEGVAALYADDALLMPPGASVIHGKAAIKEYFDKDIVTNGAKLSIKAEATEVGGDWGWRSGAWSVVDAPGVTGKYIEVWHHTVDGWKLQRDIWNADATPPAPAPAPEPATSAAAK